LERILANLAAVEDGRGRLLLLVGEPGIGKSRLARESLGWARANGAATFTGRCFEQHSAVPFFPFTEMLQHALAGAPDPVLVQARHRWPELGYLVREFDAETPVAPAANGAQVHVFRAVTAFLRALADSNALVLLLEDLHRADTTSLELLLFLARHLERSRIFSLGTCRDIDTGGSHPLQWVHRELVRDRLVETLRIRRFDQSGTAALVRDSLGIEAVPDEFLQLIHQQAEGNPFFTEELLAAMIDNGTLAVRQGGIQWRVVGDIEVPRSIRSIVVERVARQPIQSQEVLRLANPRGVLAQRSSDDRRQSAAHCGARPSRGAAAAADAAGHG
jgi:predicted ATPase